MFKSNLRPLFLFQTHPFMMNNKENLPITPTSRGENFPHSATTPTPIHKLPLKPISPNKQKTGKLSFVESDNLDEHFNLLHTTQEEIQQQLYNIELNSKQTHVDLEQLFNRLKNNNENLNKLLSSVVTYSQEVMTEGNATKADMNKIIQRLDKLSEDGKSNTLENLNIGLNSVVVTEIHKILTETRSTSIPQLDYIKDEIEKLKETLSTDNELMSSQLIKQDAKQDQLKELSKQQLQKSEEVAVSLKSSTGVDEIRTQLRMLKDSLLSFEQRLPPTDMIHQITSPIISELLAVSLDNKTTTLLESILENASKTTRASTHNDSLLQVIIQKLDNLEKLQQHLKIGENLESKNKALEEKYELLCKSYAKKFDDYKELQNKYKELQEDIEIIHIPTSNRESKMENLKNFHKIKLGEIESNDFVSERKRIASTPMVKLRNANFSNNSDEEL